MILFFIQWLVWLLSPFPQADIYHVIHVKGTIVNQTKGDTIRVGNKLNPADKLLFKTPKATATVLSPVGGRFTLGLPAAKQSSNGEELINLLKDVLVGETTIAKLSTRGLVAEKITDLKGVFATDSMVFLGNRSKLVLDPAVYPVSHNQYFVYQYTYHTDKTARKRIPFRGDTLIFDKRILYTYNGQQINFEHTGEIEIYKVNIRDQRSVLIGNFKPIFVSDQALKSELEVIGHVLQNRQLSGQEITDQMYYHILAIYGKTDENMLKLWLQEHLKM